MPQIPQAFMKCVFFLYGSEGEAQTGAQGGATGFFVGVPLSAEGTSFQLFAVTCKHCVQGRETLYARINLTAGGVATVEMSGWEEHDGGADVAACLVGFDDELLDFKMATPADFATEQMIAEYQLGPGDDVFMVGRFRGFEGVSQNFPTMRFGNISAMPSEPVIHPEIGNQTSYLVEMRSLPGYSGSPVFVFQTNAIRQEENSPAWSMNYGLTGPYLLGIDWCHFKDKTQVLAQSGVEFEQGAHVETNSGMAGVVPVAKLSELLGQKRFREHIKRQSAAIQSA